ncbi:MAG TPA: hypothetical protein VH595_12655 [Verrucomicrobiae bacterium]|nr:hypothetical protein [Verrucomicrobiae bacterium]
MKKTLYLLFVSVLITASAAVNAQSPPSITNDLTNVTVMAGGPSTFSIGVTGAGPFTYQWFFNGAPISLITTVAGNGYAGYSGDNGPATSAELHVPWGVAVDSIGNLFIADDYNYRIREVNPDGIIKTVAGNGTLGFSGDGGSATNAEISYPPGVALDSIGNLFIADGSNRIRKVGTNGIITTIAGTNTGGYSGDGSAAVNAQLDYVNGVAVDNSGNVYIGDTFNQRIRKVDTNGIMTTVAGNGNNSYSGDGGPATNAALWIPTAWRWTLSATCSLPIPTTSASAKQEQTELLQPSLEAAPMGLVTAAPPPMLNWTTPTAWRWTA